MNLSLLIDINNIPKGATLRIKGQPGYYKVFRRDFKRGRIWVKKIDFIKSDCMR